MKNDAMVKYCRLAVLTHQLILTVNSLQCVQHKRDNRAKATAMGGDPDIYIYRIE